MTSKIIWFRNDLRTTDNTALLQAAREKSMTLRSVFCITLNQWQQHDWGNNKIGFVLNNLITLQQKLNTLNIPLDIIDCQDFKQTPAALLAYLEKNKCHQLYFNKEYELNEIQRDQLIISLLQTNAIETYTFDDQTLLPPQSIKTQQGKPYTVFTPYKRSWYQLWHSNPKRPLASPSKRALNALTDTATPENIFYVFQANKSLKNINTGILSELIKSEKNLKLYQNLTSSTIQTLWPAGEKQASKQLRNYANHQVQDYDKTRDFPAQDGTSQLSPYLAAGVISPRQCVAAIDPLLDATSSGADCWLNELIWRDFYKQIIFNFPKVCKLENFNATYNKVKWLQNKQWLEKWQQGATGLPIIDAAQRQLVQTGWMHNRLRMVTAMFLTKSLLIDWRIGEKFFAEHLIDLDFASNNGGWQWSASTGTDAAPYFRIFNPVTQSQRFDPNGAFIKQFCPELEALSAKQIHDPSSHLSSLELKALNYPKFNLDLKAARLKAIEAFKQASG